MELDLILGANANEAILTMVDRNKRLHLFYRLTYLNLHD